MGCDIHPHYEVRRGGKWERHDARGKYETGKYDDGSPHTDYDKWWADPLYIGRNYDLFAILANVRNGVGFAGVRTGGGFTPIAMPRGIPQDVSRPVMDDYCLVVIPDDPDKEWPDAEGLCFASRAQEWVDSGASYYPFPPGTGVVSNPDYHSASWLTAADLLAYDWTQTTSHEGWVDPWNFELWRRTGKPRNWYGGVGGSAVTHVSNRQMAAMIDGGEIQWVGEEPAADSWEPRKYTTGLQRTMSGWDLKTGSMGAAIRDNQKHYTLVEWTERYADSVGGFVTKTIPAMLKLGEPADVRLVFWFDN